MVRRVAQQRRTSSRVGHRREDPAQAVSPFSRSVRTPRPRRWRAGAGLGPERLRSLQHDIERVEEERPPGMTVRSSARRRAGRGRTAPRCARRAGCARAPASRRQHQSGTITVRAQYDTLRQVEREPARQQDQLDRHDRHVRHDSSPNCASRMRVKTLACCAPPAPGSPRARGHVRRIRLVADHLQAE